MRKLFSFGLLFFLIPLSSIFAYNNPGNPTGFVNDFAGVLNEEQKTNLENKLTNFEKETTNEISVVIIPNLGGDTVENYAEKLFKDWGIGKEKEDNGALLLIAIEDREMRIEVGYGLEPSLTDLLSSRIIREVLTPAFQQSDFYGGIDSSTNKMVEIAKGNIPKELQGEAPKEKTDWGEFFPFLILIFIWTSSILARSKSWWLGGVMGGVLGIIIGFLFGFLFIGVASIVGLTILGLIFDFIVSKAYSSSKSRGINPPWWIGGGGMGGGGGGGFGGFGGGMSGGGGASGRW